MVVLLYSHTIPVTPNKQVSVAGAGSQALAEAGAVSVHQAAPGPEDLPGAGRRAPAGWRRQVRGSAAPLSFNARLVCRKLPPGDLT